ncbi:MAG: hypothetical protein U9P44_01840 [archaeon]|nr:hypothetical protein [archaeon]
MSSSELSDETYGRHEDECTYPFCDNKVFCGYMEHLFCCNYTTEKEDDQKKSDTEQNIDAIKNCD